MAHFRPFQQEEGQILVLFAITAASLLAMIGLLYSFGVVLTQRRAMQAAADAASLAGAWQVLGELGSDSRCDTNVNAAVLRYATANGAESGSVSALYVDASGTQLGSVGSVGACPANQFPVAARGIRVSVSSNVPTILPGFVNTFQVLVQDSATATARSTLAPTSAPVVPIAVSASAYAAHGSYDLFANSPSGNQWATLDLTSAGAPAWPSSSTPIPSVEAQYWSDGQHLGSWQLSQPATVRLASAADYASIAAGLHDNVRRQALTDASGNAYALVSVPIYDSVGSNPASVHVVGFAQLKVVGSTVTSSSARGTFVPYAAAAFGTPSTPSLELGATLVSLTS